MLCVGHTVYSQLCESLCDTSPRRALNAMRTLLDWWQDYRARHRPLDEDLLGAVEDVVLGTEPKMRLVPGYQRKLAPAVASALGYVGELVHELPPAVECGREAFKRDARVAALFATPLDLQQAFSRNDDLRALFEKSLSAEHDHVYALLCMTMQERTVFGVEMSGDVMRRDVPQVALSFADHSVLSPALNEDDARASLRRCMLDGLVAHAMEQLLEGRACHSGLHDSRQVIEAKWRSLRSRGRALETVLQPTYLRDRGTGDRCPASEVAADAAQALQPLSPAEELEQVRRVLEHAERYLQIRQTAVRVSRLMIKQPLEDEAAGARLDLSEVRIGDTLQRVVMLTKFPRQDLLPRQNFLGDALRRGEP